MKRVTTIIIGGGQCGLAMSTELTKHGIDHIILERGQVGNSWRTERWDSLKLLSPNWMNGLPGLAQFSSNPEGFMQVSELVGMFDVTLENNDFPLVAETQVLDVSKFGDGYLVQTDQGTAACDSLVIATGACSIPKIPTFASELPPNIEQFTPISYKRPSDLPSGDVLVVGASASGLQLAREIQLSGRQVTLAVGNHLRLPRRYRNADIMTWMHLVGVFDEPYTDVDDIERVRRLPSLPLMGHLDNLDLDLNNLQAIGVEIVGRLAAITNGKAWFSGSLANSCMSADLKMNRLLNRIDEWVTEQKIEERVDPVHRFDETNVSQNPRLQLDVANGPLQSVIWATGFNPDHSWLKLPVFDRKGRIQHDGGVVGNGIYVMGLPYLRNARSVHIDGASRDAKVLAQHLVTQLAQPLAA